MLLWIVATPGVAAAAEALQFPLFRHIDRSAPAPQAVLPKTLVLLTDEDFAPFSFKAADGHLNGISVELAVAACAELKIQCQVKTLPFAGLLDALKGKQGNAVIAGPLANAQTMASFSATRPYYYSFSQFLVRNGTNLTGPDEKSLTGRRLGFIKGSQQELFLKTHYDRSNLVPFTATDALFEALRTGGLDVAFADSLQASFWLKGSDARECCAPLGQSFVDKSTFTHGMVMLTRTEDSELRDAFDHALDQLQDKGTTSKILSSYLPVSPF
ncbi:transporter substrate-binding domain-containing protein [Aestuariivirga litoralis]|uniref:transporter substrate-binding domain-containing protein n=1 Tax=Aestuariivirga litoralis TaxID=2650924 RepID=UPI0018C4C102|nr:transporter substrate-binding domain-containing protein [Aestuariivirga litoralis]